MTDVAEAAQARTARAEQTMAAITEAALALFRERGYEAATMRTIAERAGVSTGNAYYYFGSKEELIQEFYLRNHARVPDLLRRGARRAAVGHRREHLHRLLPR